MSAFQPYKKTVITDKRPLILFGVAQSVDVWLHLDLTDFKEITILVGFSQGIPNSSQTNRVLGGARAANNQIFGVMVVRVRPIFWYINFDRLLSQH